MTGKYRNLTDEEIAALQAFVEEYGRKWKSILSCVYWPKARVWWPKDDHGRKTNHGYILHSLRNSHGPDWLDRFKLPKVSK